VTDSKSPALHQILELSVLSPYAHQIRVYSLCSTKTMQSLRIGFVVSGASTPSVYCIYLDIQVQIIYTNGNYCSYVHVSQNAFQRDSLSMDCSLLVLKQLDVYIRDFMKAVVRT
jgi:hypothetical protein